MHPENSVLQGWSALPTILPQSPQLCKNGCLPVLSSAKNREGVRGPSQVSRVDGGRQWCCFWPRILLWKRMCEMVCYHDATASSFVTTVQGKVFAHFRGVTIKHTVVYRNDCSACSDEFFVNKEHVLDFALHLSHPLQSKWIWAFPFGGMLDCYFVSGP
jgi:hypothetical protein